METTEQTVWISCDHVKLILDEYSIWTPKETGGILMGYQVSNGYCITDVVGPGPEAQHNRASFKPDNHFHESEMARIYLESDRIHTYLGDWHTHPGNRSYLSKRDKKTMQNISLNSLCRLPEPLMLVLGSHPLQFKVWRLRKDSFCFFQELQIYI